jgi:hypothetical protein
MCTILRLPFISVTMNLESNDSLSDSSHRLSGRSSRVEQNVEARAPSIDEHYSAKISEAAGGVLKGYTPTVMDVCSGRGKKNWKHKGNSEFRKLVHSNVAAYMNAPSKHEKTLVVKAIVDVIRSNGGRFLKQGSDDDWYDIGDNQAKEKVGHSLRDQVSAITKQKRETTSRSGSSPRFSPALPHQVSSRSLDPTLSGGSRRFSYGSVGSDHSSRYAAPVPVVYSSSYSHASGSLTSSSSRGLRSLPTELSGILEQIHFPSIEAPAPAALEVSNSSSMGVSSSTFPNFYEPLDMSMEPTPLREGEEQAQGQRQQGDQRHLGNQGHPEYKQYRDYM